MTKFIYCSVCGTKTQVILKALKGYGRIIGLVTPHECLDEPVELDLTPSEVPTAGGEVNQKFVEKLNQLKPGTIGSVSTADLRDRRVEESVKSTAPSSVADLLKTAQSSIPEGDIRNEPEGD